MKSSVTIGFALCGSFCTFSLVIPIVESLVEQGYSVIPIMSNTAYNTDTRFGKAEEFAEKICDICHTPVVHTIYDAEPFGPKKLLDALIIEPCTGNTLGKLANGISDTPVTLAAKAHLRNHRPIIIAVSTNDALAGSAQNIGKLLATKYYYFVPCDKMIRLTNPTRLLLIFHKLRKRWNLPCAVHKSSQY